MTIASTFHGAIAYGAGPRTVVGSAVGADALIIGFISLDDDSQTPTVTDNLGTPTVYSLLPTLTMTTTGVILRPFVGVTTVSGTPTLSIDVPNHSGIRGAVLAFEGFGGTPTSVITPSDVTGGTSPLTYSVSPAVDCVLVAILANEAFFHQTEAAGWTLPDNGAGGRPDLAYQVTTAGAHSGNVATIGADATWYTRTFAYGLSGGGGGGGGSTHLGARGNAGVVAALGAARITRGGRRRSASPFAYRNGLWQPR